MKKILALLLTAALFISLGAPAFAAEKPAAFGDYPGVDELEKLDTIPDPFKFFDASNDPTGDGYVSSTEEWEARREEIKDLFQHYWYGYKWPTEAKDVKGGTLANVVPNMISTGGGWFSGQVNPGEVFNQLVDKVKTEGVTVGTTTYGPTTTGNEQALAIDAWNAGYSYHWTYNSGWFPMEGDSVMKDIAGTITASTIPSTTKIEYNLSVSIENPALNKSASFKINLTMPSNEQRIAAWGNATDPVPVMIGVGGTFSAQALQQAGYGIISFNTGDIYPDKEGGNGHENRDGVYTTLYPYDPDVYEYSSGAQMAWAWAVSQISTALEQPSGTEDVSVTFGEEIGIDPTRVGVTGHSRNGQTSIVAAAFDERIDVCLPSEPATGSYRYKVEGKIFNWNVSYYPAADRVYGKTGPASNGLGGTWFSGAADAFDADGCYREMLLPFDPSDLISLVAPRPYFVMTGIHMHWQGNEGLVSIVNAASEVYDYIGENDTERHNIGIRARESSHANYYNFDIPFAIAILDREFKQGPQDTKLHVQDLYPTGNSAQNMSFPAADYDNISDMTSHPFEISSAYMPWTSPNKYLLWTAQDSFLTEHDVTIVAHSDAPDVKLMTPEGVIIDADSHSGEEFTFKLSADEAVYGRYELYTVGSAKQNRSVFFSAISVADALRHGTTKGDEGEENRVLGFSSRLSNTEQDPPVVYINGVATDMNFTSDRTPPQETTLIGYGIQFHDKLFSRIATEGWDKTGTFGVKNLKFVTLPGYTFEFSMADIYASANNSGKDGASRFTKAISWPVERYNNGEADVWPPIPYGPQERAAYDSGTPITRPEAPAPWTTDFDADIVSIKAKNEGPNGNDSVELKIKFSEPLNKGEFAFGFDFADDWHTQWNRAGDLLNIFIPRDSFTKDVETGNMIIFRLMDLDNNLIAKPIELSIDLPAVGEISDEDDEDDNPFAGGAIGAPADVEITITDSNGDAAPAGVEVGLYDGNALIGTYVTGSNGKITIPALEPGDYRLVVRDAPEGYEAGASADLTVMAGRDMKVSLRIKRTAPVEKPEAHNTLLETGRRDGFVSGYEDGTIRPEAAITRAEVAAMFFRVLSDEAQRLYTTTVNNFTDVGREDWYNTAVSTLSAMGIINGYPDGTFAPNAKITRAEFAAIAAKFAQSGAGTVSFNDIAGHWAADSIRTAAANEWISGYEDGSFRPDKQITRAEAMSILNRMLGRSISSANELPKDMTTFSDNMDTTKWYYLDVQSATNRI